MKNIIFALLVLVTLTAHADVYKTVDANGNVTYTDKPTGSNSTPIDLPKTNTVPSTTDNTASSDNSPLSSAPQTNNTTPSNNAVVNESAKKPYVKFLISSPADQETIQNQPSIPIKIEIQPALQEGDVIQIYLDGAPWGNALPATTFELTAPDRGTHVISATLFDKSMRVLKQSNSNTIYVHHAHI